MRLRDPFVALFATGVLFFPTSAVADIWSGLVAYYPFDGNAQNSVPGGHDGLVHGATLVTDRFGQPQGAYRFDGDDWIEVDATGFPTAERTVSVWFNAEDVSLRPCLVAYAGSESSAGTGRSWFMCINHAGQESFHMSSHWETNAINYYYPAPPESNWFHFVVTTNPQGTSLYVNGEVKATNTIFVDDTPSAGTDFTIGVIVGTDGQGPFTDGNVGYFRGEIDDVRVYSRALTNADVMALFLHDGTVCGDSVVGSLEECDDGGHVNGDGCDENCTFTGCGNGIVTTGENCDDGNDVDGDGCEADCTPSCGNGVVDSAANEQCDDANQTDDDGCDSNCTLGGCGNGILNASASETCDDGNLINDDGCDGNCTVTGCGNGVLTVGEECDDGDAVSGDGCEPDCTRSCGNGVVDGLPTEECDDGNRISGDGCDSNCTSTSCGNGIATSGEECDSGVPMGTGQCDPSCQLICLAPSSGALAWWPGETDARDVAGGRNGSEVAAVTFDTGKVGNAFSFDGTSFVEVADDPAWTFGDEAFSINLWVNIQTLASRSPFLGHDENGGAFNKWIFWYDADGHRAPFGPALRLHLNSPTLGAIDTVVAPWSPTTGQWYHVAVTRDGSTYTLYIDGAEVASELDTSEIPDPIVPLTIGKAEEYLLQGLVDEVQIHDRALTATEIAAIHDAGIAGECPPCGDGNVGPNEQCDDANAIASDGCEPGCVFTPESASASVGPGEIVTTDTEADGATSNDPVETSVQLPLGGTVEIAENVSGTPDNYGILGHSIDITAPEATSEAPLVVRFRFDASQVPPEVMIPDITVVKDGAAVLPCTEEVAIAVPDPCVAGISTAADGDVEIVVLTSTASRWEMSYCGNGRREGAEKCDLGSASPHAACSDCQVDVAWLVPGAGTRDNCAAEWILPLEGTSVDGVARVRRVVCVDGDPDCDVDHQRGCTVQVSLCLNVADPRLECSSAVVKAIEASTTKRKANEPTSVSNSASLAEAIASLGARRDGVCVQAGSMAASCAADSACDSSPEAGDGECREFLSFEPGLDEATVCSQPFHIRVPLRSGTSKRGIAKVGVAVLQDPILDDATSRSGDIDKLRVVCLGNGLELLRGRGR